MKVLLVDDEPLITKGLSTMIRKFGKDDFSIMTTNISGEALEISRKDPPDLLITDIRMPDMDGIQLVTKLQEEKIKVPVIFASSYDDFTYVKQAMQLGGTDYLLKPIQADELKLVVEKVRKKIAEDQLSEQLEHIKEQDIFFDRLLRKYFRMGLSESEQICYKDRSQYLENWSDYTMLVLKGTASSDILKKNLLRLLDEQVMTYYPLLMGPSELLILTSGIPHNKLKNLALQMTKELDLTAGIVSGGKTIDELRQLYPYLRQMLVEDIRWVIDFSNLKPSFVSAYFNKEIEYQIRSYIKDSNFMGLHHFFDDQFKKNCQEHEKKIRFKYLVIMLYRIAREFILEEDWTLQSLMEFINLEFSENKCQKWLSEKVDVLQDILRKADNQYSPVISNMLKLVTEDLTQRYSLKTLAERFNMNSAYLGQLFQKEVGESFKTYDQKMRMKEAQRLIKETSKRISVISAEVGYEDISHFYRHYKKDYGITPNKARRNS